MTCVHAVCTAHDPAMTTGPLYGIAFLAVALLVLVALPAYLLNRNERTTR